MELSLIPIRRALASVSNKSGLGDLARFLVRHGVEIVSTGGTARFLRSQGIPIVEISSYTGFPEILDGRVKTLHPKVHAGLLAVRDKEAHRAELESQGIGTIDLVVVNLYPFCEVAARADASFEEVIEQIDIGGPSMVRSAAKNHAYVGVVTDPDDYAAVSREMESNSGALTAATRFALARKAFALTAAYDGAIASYLGGRVSTGTGAAPPASGLPQLEVLALEKVQDLRYGENPHQRGAFYRRSGLQPRGVAGARVLQGKELSYNNLLDSTAAWELVLEFDRPATTVIKHTNPSGVAQADTLAAAYLLARETDPVSAFGSVVACNRELDEPTAREIAATFVEVVLAPSFSPAARELLGQKKNLRLLEVGVADMETVEHRQINGGFLIQDRDLDPIRETDLRVVTRRPPSREEMDALLFGWRVVKHVKSNAIVFCDATRTLGIGAGQMSRVDSVRLGAARARLPLRGCALASDAFFPFADGLLVAAEHGVRAVIQPGGSVRDAEVIEAADRNDIAMVFTGVRHFRH